MKNVFTCTARVTQDARIYDGKQRMANLGCVTSQSKKDNDEWIELPLYFNATGFGFMADQLEKAKKGDMIFISGTLVNDFYIDKSGTKRYNLQLRTTHIEVVLENRKNAYNDDVAPDDIPPFEVTFN